MLPKPKRATQQRERRFKGPRWSPPLPASRSVERFRLASGRRELALPPGMPRSGLPMDLRSGQSRCRNCKNRRGRLRPFLCKSGRLVQFFKVAVVRQVSAALLSNTTYGRLYFGFRIWYLLPA